jgi:hypothetical protein
MTGLHPTKTRLALLAAIKARELDGSTHDGYPEVDRG